MTTATLTDGRSVDSASPEWRAETLARAVLAMPLDERRLWLAGWEKRHGAKSAQGLKDTITALHAQRKAE